MGFRVGVLVIGSLFWDQSSTREAWRGKRLEINQKMHVQAPIRYGRRSKTRGCTYTMVFSNPCHHLDQNIGRAILIPCNQVVECADELIEEASHLWSSESKTPKSSQIGSSWGTVALLHNLSSGVPQSIFSGWTEYFQNNSGEYKPLTPVSEHPLVSQGGFLQIGWPKESKSRTPVELDLILGCVANPTLTNENNYDSVDSIADAWINNGSGHEHYFFKNISSGIRTFQDLFIWQRFRTSNIEWLKQDDYQDAINQLEKELKLPNL